MQSCSYKEMFAVEEVVLTFDDAPNFPGNTSKILDILVKHEAKATFFCIGQSLESQPELAHRIAVEQLMANHSYTHMNLRNQEMSQIFEEEILRTQQLIDSLQPNNPHYFRPPYGQLSEQNEQFLKNKGFRVVFWDLSAEEWDPDMSTQEVVDYFHENLYFSVKIPIILFHLSDSSVEALDILLNEFEVQGIKIITLDKLAK